MDEMYDVVVIGTGFVGATIENILSKRNFKHLTIQPEREKFNFRWSKKTIIDERHIQRTTKIYGGMGSWGGAVSLPLKKNNLSTRQTFFETINEFQKNRKVKKLFGINPNLKPKNFVNDRYLNKSLENLGFPANSWVKEQNYYAGGKFSSKFFALKTSKHVVCRIVDIKKLPNGNFKIVTIRKQKEVNIITKDIICAAGNFMNAKILQFMEIKKRKHNIGNHIYADIGEVELDQPILISELFQSYYPNDRKFYNLRFADKSQKLATDISIRLIPIDVQESTIELKLMNLNSWIRTHIQRSRAQKFYGNERIMVKKFKIVMYVNIVPNKSNYFSLDNSNNIYYKLEIDEKTEKDIKKCLKQIVVEIHKTNINSKIICENVPLEMEWKDAAHYYASTTPKTINSRNPELKPSVTAEGIHFLGGSSFHSTWDIHPTFLYVRNAIEFMKSYTRKDSKFSK
jgi:hypothetical protein